MFESLITLVSKYTEIDAGEINRDTDFFDELGYNSYEFMCLLEDIEDELGCYITDIEASEIKTVGDVLAIIEK